MAIFVLIILVLISRDGATAQQKKTTFANFAPLRETLMAIFVLIILVLISRDDVRPQRKKITFAPLRESYKINIDN